MPKSNPEIFTRYLQKQTVFPPFISEMPDKNLGIIIVIPCFNEPDIENTLLSIKNCDLPEQKLEIIVVVNNSETSTEAIKKQNIRTYKDLLLKKPQIDTSTLSLHPVLCNNMPKKHAGVGFARKAGMDEAIRRFEKNNHTNGIIVSLDADTLVEKNYLTAIEQLHKNFPDTSGCSLYFEHATSGNEFPEKVYRGITRHELYLRYYVEALRYTGFPYAFHAIGSCFTVRADIYAMQGGMNRKQGGEDFYFLHKIFPLGEFRELNTTTVFPSSRPSNRVPFGTGPVVSKRMEEKEFLTYSFKAFEDLKMFFAQINAFFRNAKTEKITDNLAKPLQEFLTNTGFYDALKEINQNTASTEAFTKRFFGWFDALRILKYLNFVHEKFYDRVHLTQVCDMLLQALNKELNCKNEMDLLLLFRDFQRQR